MFQWEDPFPEDEWEAWIHFQTKIGEALQCAGDDLPVTNLIRFKKAIEEKACNSLLLKVNQIGSLTEFIKLGLQGFLKSFFVSHQSGETQDCFIADLVIGIHAGQIKAGASVTPERLSKNYIKF